MEKEKFFSGLWIIIGLIFGSVFTNFVYQDYLAYGGTVRSLVLNNTDLYKASISLFFYILFKRGKQYAFIYLGAYLLQPWIFLYSFAFCMAFFFGSMLSLQIVQMGIKGLVLVFMSLFPHFICYVITLLLLIKRNFYAQKKEEMLYEQRHSFLFRFSIWFEITFIIYFFLPFTSLKINSYFNMFINPVFIVIYNLPCGKAEQQICPIQDKDQ
mgnify:CR=1 FL=1